MQKARTYRLFSHTGAAISPDPPVLAGRTADQKASRWTCASRRAPPRARRHRAAARAINKIIHYRYLIAIYTWYLKFVSNPTGPLYIPRLTTWIHCMILQCILCIVMLLIVSPTARTPHKRSKYQKKHSQISSRRTNNRFKEEAGNTQYNLTPALSKTPSTRQQNVSQTTAPPDAADDRHRPRGRGHRQLPA